MKKKSQTTAGSIPKTERRTNKMQAAPVSRSHADDLDAASDRIGEVLTPIFLSICRGRSVLDLSGRFAAALEGAATRYTSSPQPQRGYDCVLLLAPRGLSAEQVREIREALDANALLVVCSDSQAGEDVDYRRLGGRYAKYSLRSFAGLGIAYAGAPPGYSPSHIDPERGPFWTMRLWSSTDLPRLPQGIFETGPDLDRMTVGAEAQEGWRIAANQEPGKVALANRLLAKDGDQIALFRKAEIERRLAAVPAGAGVSFDIPRHSFPWPLADQGIPISSLGLYDRRPDDLAIDEARRGKQFVERFGLETDAPDFAGAVGEINSLTGGFGLDVAPDVSIIVPIYGQLAYTLGCIHSLRQHSSRYKFEVIIVDDRSPDMSLEFLNQIDDIRVLKKEVNGGFIDSSNKGAQIAHGKFVVMLNNDTRVVLGWLDNLIDSFGFFPKAGLVGSKMLYGDGSLQEAGGIIWRDGSAWNYGRGDDPGRPQYCYARQVDYISGCSIAMRRDQWDIVGGFNTLYAPAYCEDADLALAVVRHGLEVWYQPQSRIIHYEGKTSGSDVTKGVKAYQVVNSKKLYWKWREKLESHRRNGDSPFFERERAVTRRLLVVDAVTPTPDQDAGSLQTVMALQAGIECGYKVHFVPEDNWLLDPKYTAELQKIGVDCSYAPFELGLEAFLRRYGWLFDAVLVYRIGVMEKSLTAIRQFAPQAALMFHVADLHHLRLERQGQLAADTGLLDQVEALKILELDHAESADCVITHSETEAEILTSARPAANVVVWPLMSELFGTARDSSQRSGLLFLGGYKHEPNVDAAKFLVEQLLPLLSGSDMNLTLAGANPTPEILALQDPRIEVTGLVSDLREVFDRALVFVCPLRYGAGVKGKIITALSYGLPIVTSSVGIEGTNLIPGKHVLVANTAEQMADAVLELHNNRELWQALSVAGQDFVADEVSPKMGRRVLREAIETAHAKRLGLGAVRG